MNVSGAVRAPTGTRPPARRRVRWAVCLAITAVVALGPTAEAHEPGTSVIELDVGAEAVTGHLDVPIEELAAALDSSIATDPLGLSQQRERLLGYLDDHLELAGPDGAWVVDFGHLTVATVNGVDYLRAAVDLRPPGGDTDSFTLAYDGLIESDDAHQVIVTIVAQDDTIIAAVLDADLSSVDVAALSTSSTFGTIVGEGFDHVLDGADHIVFLLALLLPAPLVVAGRRWVTAVGPWHAFVAAAKTATAFTIGHSITLVASSLDWVSAPADTVEIVIALSVGVSGVHAIRPLARRGTVAIAGVFGLVHGMAFATLLDGLGLSSSRSATSLLAFNVGVELAQLAIIAATFPALWMLSRTPVSGAVRTIGGSVAVVAAIGWIVERVGLIDNPLAGAERWAMGHLAPLSAALLCAAVIAHGAEWVRAARDRGTRVSRTATTSPAAERRHTDPGGPMCTRPVFTGVEPP